MIVPVFGILIFLAIATSLFIVAKKVIFTEETNKFKKIIYALLGFAALLSIGVAGSTQPTAKVTKTKDASTNTKLQDELKAKEEQLAIMTEKVRLSVEQARQAKAETELHTSNVVKLQEELLRRNDEFNLVKEELDLRYKVNADRLLRENEDKIRKSASVEAQRLLEAQQLKARIKVAKDDIESKIVSKWTPPKDKHDLIVVVKYAIDRAGQVSKLELVQRSGSSEVDNSVLDAIKAAAPFAMSKEDAVFEATKQMTSKFVLP